MPTDARLDKIRTTLFHGLLDYTKSFPDFSLPQGFLMTSPREGRALLENVTASLEGEKELLLYVHFPFCVSECVFCNTFPQKVDSSIQASYIDGLLKEIDIYCQAGIFDGRRIKSIYLGGGTPTAFPSRDIEAVLGKIISHTELFQDCSITCEAHPNDLIKNDRMREIASLPINRISLGCQTFEPTVLELCKRSNPRLQVKEVIRKSRQLGMSTNVDMMIGLPGQTLEGVKRDLDVLSDMAPHSIEYMRHEIVNPRAVSLYRGQPDLLVKDDELFSMAYHTQEWMEQKGYEQNGRFTSDRQFPYRYYWLEEVPFIALGARSRSYTKSLCYDKHEDVSLYLQLIDKGTVPVARHMVLNKKEQMYRSLFLSMQLRKGLDLGAFKTRFGEDALDVFPSLVRGLGECGCVTADDSSLRLTKYGRFFVEDVCCFIIDEALREGGYRDEFRRISHSSGGRSARYLQG